MVTHLLYVFMQIILITHFLGKRSILFYDRTSQLLLSLWNTVEETAFFHGIQERSFKPYDLRGMCSAVKTTR